MGKTDPHAIRSAEALRAIVGAEIPGLGLKNEGRLNEFAVAFLQAYIFTVLTCIYLNDAIHMH